MKCYKVGGSLGRDEMVTAIDSSLLLGFQAVAAKFPVITEKEGDELPKNFEEVSNLWKMEGKSLPEQAVMASDYPGEVFDLEFRTKKGLEYLFLKGELLKDKNHDLLPDCLDVKIQLPEVIEQDILLAACNLAYRLGMETTAYQGSIVATEGYQGNAIVFEEGDAPRMTYEEDGSRIVIRIAGKGEELLQFISKLCNEFPKQNVMRTWRDVLLDMVDDFVLRGKDGQLAAVQMYSKADKEPCVLYGAPDIEEEQKKHFEKCTFYNHRSGKKIYEKEYELPWEVDVLKKIWKDSMYPQIPVGHAIKIEAAVSENQKIREELNQDIRTDLMKLGCKDVDVQVVCAYKQGFSWITEQVLPRVKELSEGDASVSRFEIYFKPFLPEGETEWVDENGATPSYHNLKAENPDKWYDLPIRYLQELYPVMDIIQTQLGLSEEQVVFTPYEGKEDITYFCKVVTTEDTVLYEEKHKVYCSERPYLNEYPNLGKVHPSTGFIRLLVDGKEVAFQKIPTDLEGIWDIYQSEVLPDCRKYIEEKLHGNVRIEDQPLFNKLELDVTVSEPDERVGCREDMISSLDALHEDMYFAGSDYFKNYGNQYADGMLDAPGLILPQIHCVNGTHPKFKVTLYESQRNKACVMQGTQVCMEQSSREHAQAWMSEIGWKQGGLQYVIQTEGVSAEYLQAYAELMKEGVLTKSKELGACEIIWKDQEKNEFGAKLQDHKIQQNGRIEDINLLESELIGYDEYLQIMEHLKKIPQIEVFETATSYAGRKIYGIWLKPEVDGYVSMTKRISMYPSEIINARHHANEVSSTNASFMLLKRLLTDEIYKDLTEKLNLVLVPMENVDGAAIHYELQKEHPHWKLHVARFNSLGKEFYYEHFKPDSLHSEAMGLSRLYERFVPDIVVDNHGVPSHEWEQQFSGYTSPSYKGFWLPRSLLYGYFWYVTNPEYKENFSVNQVMQDVIADKIAENPTMKRWNIEWSHQFEKYAHAWLPKLFPAEYYKDMINYWIPFAADPNHRYPSIRFPWITTVAYTSEVADETAQGEYLNLCALAHVVHDEATIQMLLGAESYTACNCNYDEERIFTEYNRCRPMKVVYSEK